MKKLGKRGAGIEMESLVKIILLLVFLVVAASIVIFLIQDFTIRDFKVYGCWAANGIMSSNVMFRKMEVPCKNEVEEKPMNKAEFSRYLADTWFMYGKGDWDFHITSDDSIQVAAFIVSEDIKIRDLFVHLLTHKGKRNLLEDGVLSKKDFLNSDYNYIQTGSKGQTLCFSSKLGKKDAIMKKNKIYYLLFWDDKGKDDSGDKLVLSTESSIGSSGKKLVSCCSLQQGLCYRLTGEKWYEFGQLLRVFKWETPGSIKTTPTKGMFVK